MTTHRVLIIGSNGFTGKHLTSLLRARKDVELFLGHELGVNLLQPAELEGVLSRVKPQVVVNLAAISFVADNDFRKIYEVNAFGVLNLLEAIKKTGKSAATRLVQASSGNVYGHQVAESVTEDELPRPANHYAISKVMAENFCRLYASDFEITLTRAFNCIGRGQKSTFLIPKLIQHFKDKKAVLEMGNLDIRRDFIDIRDAARIYEELIFTDKKVGTINISTDRVYSIGDIIEQLKVISNHRAFEIRINPEFVRKSDLTYQRGSNKKLLENLGFHYQYTLTDTLSDLWGE